jgi:hypothetical protein
MANKEKVQDQAQDLHIYAQVLLRVNLEERHQLSEGTAQQATSQLEEVGKR